MSTSTVAIPGQLLGPVSKYLPGPGTHIHDNSLYASILGTIQTHQPPKPAGPAKRPTKITPQAPPSLLTISILRHNDVGLGPDSKDTTSSVPASAPIPATGPPIANGNGSANANATTKIKIIPEVNSTVLCRVTRLTPRQANVDILVVGDTVLSGEWRGLIRVQDVRATEKDRVKIFESFRPGDIVRANVISLGDQSNYYLSTASNHLGVIMATSEAGNAMYPISWKEYKDPETGTNETRKVAKPF